MHTTGPSLRIPAWTAAFALGLGCESHAAAEPSRPFVGFVQEQALKWNAWEVPGLPRGLEAKILSEGAATGAVSIMARFPSGWERPPGHHVSELEILVLEGALSLGDRTLSAGWFAHLPAGTPQARLASATGAKALVFFAGRPDFVAGPSPTRETAGEPSDFRDSRGMSWGPGTVSDLPLRIKHLKRDERSGARTWLVSIGSDAEVPWESHSTVEEGYLLEGDYTLGECLADGPKTGGYEPGGYFYRPAHQLHSGPDSGTRGGAVWLMRTPARLDVDFHPACVPPSPAPEP